MRKTGKPICSAEGFMHIGLPETLHRAIAILPGPRTSFLDHLIPLCDHWQIPLVCTDAWVYLCATQFYPPVEVILVEQEAAFCALLAEYSTFVTVEPCRLYKRVFLFGQYIYRGEAETVVGFHGNPVKYRNEYWIERYIYEDHVLLYGDHLVDYCREKGIWERLCQVYLIGNLRKTFYERHKAFFTAIARPHLFPHREKQTLLWAPTWSYPHFPEQEVVSILGSIPETFQVLVKLHPFMYRLFPEEVTACQRTYSSCENILFLDEIPLVYPLIEQAHLYLGNYSSMAYDFLSLDRPIYLYGNTEQEWATSIDIRMSEIYPLFVNKPDRLSVQRRQMYAYAYHGEV